MPSFMMQLTSDALKDLENAITDFSVEEGPKLSLPAKDYLKVCIR